MSLIDWSDPEEMLGLLVEYVADEAATFPDDPDRDRFLNQLSRELGALAATNFATAGRIASSLEKIIDSQPRDFANDSVMAHLEACIEELHRIESVNHQAETSAPLTPLGRPSESD